MNFTWYFLLLALLLSNCATAPKTVQKKKTGKEVAVPAKTSKASPLMKSPAAKGAAPAAKSPTPAVKEIEPTEEEEEVEDDQYDRLKKYYKNK